MSVYVDTSDPSASVHYKGVILAEGASEKQAWKLISTESYGPCLFIDGQLQSCANDEEMYHETFVHSLMCGLQEPKRVLIFGGAEGCMIREVLKWQSVESVLQIDWDESLCNWFKLSPDARPWKGAQEAYKDPRVTLLHEDALQWSQSYKGEPFDAIFIDLLDPSFETYALMRHFVVASLSFLTPKGGLAINAGPVRPISFGCHEMCVDLSILFTTLSPTHIQLALKQTVPSFLGEWCFLMLCPKQWSQTKDSQTLPQMSTFSRMTLVQSLTWPENYPYSLRMLSRTEPKSPSEPKTPTPRALRINIAEKLVDEFPPAHFTEIDFTNHYGC